MPFQLDTGMYGQLAGGGDRQDSPLGMLGQMVDMRTKMAELQDQQRQRDLEATKAQQEIDAKNRDVQENKDLIKVFNDKNGSPGLSDLVNVVGLDRGQKLYEANSKLTNQDDKDAQGDLASAAQGVAAWPESGRADAWDAAQSHLIAKHRLDPADRAPYSPQLLQSIINSTLTPEQYTNAQINQQKTNIEQQNADREQKLYNINEPGLKAEAHMKVRSDTASRMLGAKDAASYAQIYNTLDPTTQQDFPTPDDYVRNPKQTTTRLNALGMSPAQEQEHSDRMTALQDEDRRFNITEARLNAEGGITPQMKQAALVRRANARDELQKEVSRQSANGTPMSQGDQLSRLIQIDQDYAAEVHQPPNVSLAEDRKQAQLGDLEKERQQRSQPVLDRTTQKMVPSKNPMSDQEMDGRKLGILNSYRAAYGMDPVTKLPQDWTAYRGGSSSSGAAALPADPTVKQRAQATTAPATAAPRVQGTGTLGALVPNAATPAPPSSRPLGALVNPTPPAPTPAPGGTRYVWSGGDYVPESDALAAAATQAARNAPPLAARTPAPAPAAQAPAIPAVTSRKGLRSAELASIHAQINAIRASPDRGNAANVAALARLSARAKQLQGQ